MNELIRMQDCFSKYPKLYDKKSNVNETENSSNVKLMNHPEARRQQMNHSNKLKSSL